MMSVVSVLLAVRWRTKQRGRQPSDVMQASKALEANVDEAAARVATAESLAVHVAECGGHPL